jgi:hypothetical protein
LVLREKGRSAEKLEKTRRRKSNAPAKAFARDEVEVSALPSKRGISTNSSGGWTRRRRETDLVSVFRINVCISLNGIELFRDTTARFNKSDRQPEQERKQGESAAESARKKGHKERKIRRMGRNAHVHPTVRQTLRLVLVAILCDSDPYSGEDGSQHQEKEEHKRKIQKEVLGYSLAIPP